MKYEWFKIASGGLFLRLFFLCVAFALLVVACRFCRPPAQEIVSVSFAQYEAYSMLKRNNNCIVLTWKARNEKFPPLQKTINECVLLSLELVVLVLFLFFWLSLCSLSVFKCLSPFSFPSPSHISHAHSLSLLFDFLSYCLHLHHAIF